MEPMINEAPFSILMNVFLYNLQTLTPWDTFYLLVFELKQQS